MVLEIRLILASNTSQALEKRSTPDLLLTWKPEKIHFKLRLLFFIVILPLSIASHAQVVKDIRFYGLKQTDPSYLLAITHQEIGKVYDEALWLKDIQLIRNTNLFFEVNWSKKIANDSLILDVNLNESINYIPIIDISAIEENWKLQLGVNNINWLGRNYTLGGFYQYYQRHSAKMYMVAPRHLNLRTGHELVLGSYSTIEPLYFGEESSDFNYDNYSISAAGFYWINDFSRFALGGMLMKEYYENIEKQVGDFEQGFMLDLFKYQIRGYFEHKNVNLHYQYIDGLYYKLYLENIETEDFPEASFLKLMGELKYYKRVGRKGNLAGKIELGVATNNFSPFSPFVLDSYINLRGIGNRVARGTAIGIANLEYRYTVWTTDWFFMQSNFFTDIGSLRPPGGNFDEMAASENLNIYSGLGIRIQTRKLYNAVFRFDYGWNTRDFREGGFVFGVNHFF